VITHGFQAFSNAPLRMDTTNDDIADDEKDECEEDGPFDDDPFLYAHVRQ
jgi:hypothetical protein